MASRTVIRAVLLLGITTAGYAEESANNRVEIFGDLDSSQLPRADAQLTQDQAKDIFRRLPSKAKNPGDPGLDREVYSCALKHLAGVGSDVAARIIWMACVAESQD